VIKKGGFFHQIANVWINIQVSKFDLPSLCFKKRWILNKMPKLDDLDMNMSDQEVQNKPLL